MKKTRFTEEQIVGVLHEVAGVTPISEVCRRHAASATACARRLRRTSPAAWSTCSICYEALATGT